MGPWVDWEWCKWPSEWVGFIAGTSIVLLDCEMCCAAIRLRECTYVGHTKAKRVELEGVYWRYHKIQCYIAYIPTYLCTMLRCTCSTGCKSGPLNLLDFSIAILTALLWRIDCCLNLRLSTKSRASDIGEYSSFKVREENLCHVCILDSIICEQIGK